MASRELAYACCSRKPRGLPSVKEPAANQLLSLVLRSFAKIACSPRSQAPPAEALPTESGNAVDELDQLTGITLFVGFS